MSFTSTLPLSRIHHDEDFLTRHVLLVEFRALFGQAGPASTLIYAFFSGTVVILTNYHNEPMTRRSEAIVLQEMSIRDEINYIGKRVNLLKRKVVHGHKLTILTAHQTMNTIKGANKPFQNYVEKLSNCSK